MSNNDYYLPTYTERKFNFLNPRPEDIDLLDIAHSLSGLPRYLRHTTRTITVAEHTVRMLRFLYSYCDFTIQRSFVLKYAALHDAAEAYIGEWPKPLKLSIIGEGIRNYERHLSATILNKYGVFLNGDIILAVEKVDRAIVYAETEMAMLMPYDLLPIKLSDDDIEMGKKIYQDDPDKNYGWCSEKAEAELLYWFRLLNIHD